MSSGNFKYSKDNVINPGVGSQRVLEVVCRSNCMGKQNFMAPWNSVNIQFERRYVARFALESLSD